MTSHNSFPSPAPHAIDPIPPCEWTDTDLAYFRIKPTRVDIETFFGMPEENLREIVWADSGYKAFLEAEFLKPYSGKGAAAQIVGRAMELLRHIHLIDPTSRLFNTSPNVDASTNQFTELLLMFLGMDKFGRLSNGQPIELLLSENPHDITMDVALVDHWYPSYILLCIENKRIHPMASPIAELVACAIASFQSNNRIRAFYMLEQFNHMIFPVMTFRGLCPCFCLIHVTRALADAVAHGISPDFDTKVPVLFIENDCTDYRRLDLVYPNARKQVLKIMENMKDYIPLGLKHIPEAWKKVVSEA